MEGSKPYNEFCKNCGQKFVIESTVDLCIFLAHKESCKNGDKNSRQRVRRIFNQE